MISSTVFARVSLLAAILGLSPVFAVSAPAAPSPAILGQAVLDGIITYRSNGTASVTLEGSAAKVFFTQMSADRVTSTQPTSACKSLIVKSGDQMECSHCEDRQSAKDADVTYWCDLRANTRAGAFLQNPVFSGQNSGKK